MKSFQNKTVWITGASSGIGEALAYELSRQGAKLILSARNEEMLHKVAGKCGGQPIIQALDLEQHATLPGIVDRVLARAGQVDILVNNGGISQRALVKDTSYDVDRKMIDVNLLGTITLSKALLPHFLERRSGHYVVVTSLMGKFGAPMRSAYSAAKHGLHGFFEALRAESWRDNVKVTLICPGYVRTNVSVNALTGGGKKQGTMDDATEHGMAPEEIAKKICEAVRKGKLEAVFGGKETMGVYLKRFFPGMLAHILKTAKVT